MNKINNYILNGQGLGVKFLLGLSVLMALLFAIIVRVKGVDYIPYAQEIADQMLPIKIENGIVVKPYNTIKAARLQVSDYAAPVQVPLVIDTRVDSLDTNQLPQGVYLTRTKLYTVNQNQVKMMNLEGDFDLPKADYTEDFKSWLNWSAVIGGIFAAVGLFVFYLLLTMFYALCTQFIAWIASRNFDFDRRMRLSALTLVAGYIIFIPLEMMGLHSTFLFFVLMIAALSVFVVKEAPAAVKSSSPETENAVLAEHRTEPQALTAEPLPLKKAPAKKAPHKKAPAKPAVPAKDKTKAAVPEKASPAKALVKKAAAPKKEKAAKKPSVKKASAEPTSKK